VNNDQSMQHFGDFALAPNPLTLRKGFEVLKLPQRQMEVLRLLVEAQGSAVPKSLFFEQIWSGNFVEEGNLTQTIFLLRRALGRLPDGGEYIETLPRLGYRIAPAAFTLSRPAMRVKRSFTSTYSDAVFPATTPHTSTPVVPQLTAAHPADPSASPFSLRKLIATALQSRWEPVFWIGVGMIVSLFAVIVALFSLAYVHSLNNQPAQEKSFLTQPAPNTVTVARDAILAHTHGSVLQRTTTRVSRNISIRDHGRFVSRLCARRIL
jgi:DNA-binding winged helix-turn-helix (wHTH) protein